MDKKNRTDILRGMHMHMRGAKVPELQYNGEEEMVVVTSYLQTITADL